MSCFNLSNNFTLSISALISCGGTTLQQIFVHGHSSVWLFAQLIHMQRSSPHASLILRAPPQNIHFLTHLMRTSISSQGVLLLNYITHTSAVLWSDSGDQHHIPREDSSMRSYVSGWLETGPVVWQTKPRSFLLINLNCLSFGGIKSETGFLHTCAWAQAVFYTIPTDLWGLINKWSGVARVRLILLQSKAVEMLSRLQ